jgi:NAD+ kinase
MRIPSAFVVSNHKKPIARKIKSEVEIFLEQNGVRRSSSKPRLVITVGGDGTVLFSKKFYGAPYFAIGSRTSFICQATFSDWKPKLSRAIRNLRTEKRLLLSPSLNGKALPLALNEIGIRNPEPRVLSIHLSCGIGSNGKKAGIRVPASQQKHFAFRADGALFSTPTGSPAYCYSCGGKKMKKSDIRFQAVAIAPFLRAFKPSVFPQGTACTLRISGREKAQIFIDGQTFGNFTEKDTLSISASKKKFLFAKI